MTILSGDVKLVPSQVMDDVPEGGGAPINAVINDGVSNAIFPDISELDRAGGRVSLRKCFVSVQTETVDGYYGAHVIVADGPDDPRVHTTLFSTNDVFDQRTAAKNRLEAYMAPASEWHGYLLENHITGQRTIQIFQQTNSTMPPVGKTFRLVYHEGLGDERAQYVRLTRVSPEERTYIGDDGRPYQALVLTCDLSDALRADLPGSPPSRFFDRKRDNTVSVIRDTVVADAATYFGVAKTKQAVAIGDVSAYVDSIFTQLVPSAQTEIPIIDFTAGGFSNAVVLSSTGLATYTGSQTFNSTTVLSLGLSIYPGSLVISAGSTLTDDAGQLMDGATAVGTVDYARGEIRFAATAPTYNGSKTVVFKPAAAPIQLADTAMYAVTAESRRYNYAITLPDPPAPGTMIVSYRSQGKWYDLRDNGGGQLRGADPLYGAGTISYVSGSVSATLGALPDVGSAVMFAWGSKVNYINRSAMVVSAPTVELQLTNAGATPSSVTITWNDGTAHTATDDGKGNITGSATGKINYVTGRISLTPANLPAGGQTFAVAYTYGPPIHEDFPAPSRDGVGDVSVTLANGNVRPGSVQLVWNVLIENYESISNTPAEMIVLPRVDPYKTVRDDGQGVLRDANGTSFGTVNYTTGAIKITEPDFTVQVPWPRYNVTQLGFSPPPPGSPPGTQGAPVYRNTFRGFEYKPAAALFPHDETGIVKVDYRSNTASNNGNDALTSTGVRFDLTDQYAENIVAGSIMFTIGSKTYFDRNGSLFYDIDMSNGSAIQAGSVNYQTGEVTLSGWVPGANNIVLLKSLLTRLDGQPVDEATFRIPISPIRPGSVQILATRLRGGLVNVTANTDGTISGTNVFGTIDYETGVVNVRFGAWVTAAGNETQIWYSADAVRADGKIFKPVPVFADTIKYNAVGYTYLPLDANLLGLDPVRLPQDGRVVIYKPGGFAVIGHAKSVTANVSNGQVINAGRVRLSRFRVVGANGVVINTGYTVDLEAGTLTFTDVTGYSQPVTVEDRVEDLLQVSDVQINGQLAFTRQITHQYPVGSYVSSALVAGDLKARVSVFFDQVSWNNNWSDIPTLAAATANYNTVTNPIEVTNRGAVTERWAIVFTGATTFNVIGEHVGMIFQGTTGLDCAPINPATNSPYFTIRAAGWGLGWSVGNLQRFNTVGALFPFWVARTVQQGPETVIDDSFTLLVRGDVDRP